MIEERELPITITADMTVQNILEGVYRKKIDSLLPKSMSVDRFIASVVITIAKNPKLQDCTRDSLLYACVDAAELGVDFSPVKGHAYLVPYKGTAQLIVGYRGFIDIATRYRIVARMESVLAYSNDFFEIERGTNPHITHKQYIGNDRGEVIGCYAVAFFEDNNFQFDYMTIDELNKIEKQVPTDKFWKPYKGEMQRKTVIRRLFKYLPKSEKLTALIEHDNKILELMKDDEPQSLEQVEDEVLKELAGKTEEAKTEFVADPKSEPEQQNDIDTDSEETDLFEKEGE